MFEAPAWTRPYFDAEVGTFQHDGMAWADALLLGGVAYGETSVAWPAMGDGPKTGGDVMNSIRKYVSTASGGEPAWNAAFLAGDAVEEVTRLEAEGPNLLMYGSGRLTESLRAAGLIDEYRLLVSPTVLGEGRRLFAGAVPSEFAVAECRATGSGMTLLTVCKV